MPKFRQVSIGTVRATRHIMAIAGWKPINPNGTVSRVPWDARYAKFTEKQCRKSGSDTVYAECFRDRVRLTLVDEFGRIRAEKEDPYIRF